MNRNRQLQFHKKIFAEADVIVSPTTGFVLFPQTWFLCVFHFGNTFMTFICNSVTAYPIQDDAIQTGELDYVNGGTPYMKFI